MLKRAGDNYMPKVIRCLICAVASLLLLPVIASAQGEFIYVVKVKNCKSNPRCSRSLTGFRLRGIKGIVTALHGVADAGDIRVLGEQGSARFNGSLRLTKVDIARDLALLTSSETAAAPAEGLEAAVNVNWNTMDRVTVIGRPLNIMTNQATELKLRRPQLVILRDIVSPNIAVKLLERRSPDPDREVVSISDTLLPGHSGAPILNSQNQVLAVANGGLEGGFAEFCWAIPWEKVNLVDARAAAGALAELTGLDPATLFSFDGEASTLPEIYRVRVIVLSPQKTPVEDAQVISSLGGEALRSPGGYQFEIPRAKRPQDGKVTFFASKESAFWKGEGGLVLGSDPSPAIIIPVSRDDSATVRGVVVDTEGSGVQGARVSVAGFENEAVTTGVGGGFVLPAHKAVGQMVLLRVEKEGYKAVTQSHPAGDEPVIIQVERK
ncbi:MAG TPA: trypsin-like peptidase domain-containing protein [Pyrinomonadaceae bacterium]|nr:trypsin-like peptidase domain-containing protein [Pyrinomonadaceae bacterium]